MTLPIYYFKLSFRHFPNVILTVSPSPSLEIKKPLKVYYVTFISRSISIPVWGKEQNYLKKSYSWVREWKKIWLRCISNGYRKKLRIGRKERWERNNRIRIVEFFLQFRLGLGRMLRKYMLPLWKTFACRGMKLTMPCRLPLSKMELPWTLRRLIT